MKTLNVSKGDYLTLPDGQRLECWHLDEPIRLMLPAKLAAVSVDVSAGATLLLIVPRGSEEDKQ